MTAGQLALHIAQVPGGIARLVQQNPAQAPDFGRPSNQPATLQEVLAAHDESLATARRELAKFDDAAMQELWRIKQGDRELFAVPRAKFVRERHAEPLVSAPGSTQCVPADAEYPGSGDLGTQRR